MELICHKIAKIISRNLDTENALKPEQNVHTHRSIFEHGGTCTFSRRSLICLLLFSSSKNWPKIHLQGTVGIQSLYILTPIKRAEIHNTT